nr:hypothetical protein [Tanacetum cinerariifolium]
MSAAGLTHTTSVFTGPTTKNGSEKVGNERLMNELPSSYANKLSPTSSSMANLQILEANVPNDADYDVWLPLDSVHKVNDIMKNSLSVTLLEKDLLSPLWNGLCVTIEKNTVLRDGPWIIREIPIFLSKWSPSVSPFKEEFSRVPVWVKFHDVPLVA